MTTTLARSKVGTAPPGTTPATSNMKLARRGRTRRWVTRGIWIAGGAAALVGLGLAWRPKPVIVDTGAVTRGDLVVSVEEVARTRVRDRFVVAAPLGGNLLRIELRPGDTVEASSVLARIAPMEAPLLDPRTKLEAGSRSAAAQAGERQARAAVTRAEVALQHADDELERSRRLVASGSLARDALIRAELEARLRTEELASARFAAQASAHEVTMARAALARFDGARSIDGFDVSAPVSGTILRVMSQSAGPVQPGAPLMELGDPAALEVVTEVLSADAVRIRPGAPVTLERWGGPPLQAHVRRVEPSGFTRLSALGVEEQRVPVIVDLDEPRERWSSLGDGFRVEARIVVDEKHGVLRAPLGSVFRHDGGWATYVVDAKARAKLTPVTLGARSQTMVELTQGVADGASIIVHPSERVKDGVKVAGR